MATVQELYSNIATLLKAIGDEGKCRGCGQQIWWVRTKSGKRMPVTAAGLCHFADCPAAQAFRSKPKGDDTNANAQGQTAD